jgi:uncharacterized repeat protein (TIGR03803 family)
LIQASDGSFYGTAGINAFKITPFGAVTNLATFTESTTTIPAVSKGALVQGSGGNFFGTTYDGGLSGNGTIFRLSPAGTRTTLVDFTRNGASHKGANPTAGLILATNGNFYGMTSEGGVRDIGTIFKMTSGSTLTTLVEFGNYATYIEGNDVRGGPIPGANPQGALIQASDGNFYGTTQFGGSAKIGTVFKMTPAGAFSVLASLTDADTQFNHLSFSPSGLVQGTDGNFYGTTKERGSNARGTVFKVTPAGVVTVLVNFTGNGASNKGSYPVAGLVQAADGNFYGTTPSGGTLGFGTVFKMTPAGALTTVVNFSYNGTTQKGAFPQAALAKGSDGNLYGTTLGGGKIGLGTVFRIRRRRRGF